MTQKSVQRLQHLCKVAAKEAEHLAYTSNGLSRERIDSLWVAQLANAPDLAERVDAFVARFGRLQDHLGDKLIPELMRQMLETPQSVIDDLNRMEKLGLVDSVLDWVEARNLRNRLIHEYVDNDQEFADALSRALSFVPMLQATQQRLTDYATKFASP